MLIQFGCSTVAHTASYYIYRTNFEIILHCVQVTQNFQLFLILSSLQSSCLYLLMEIINTDAMN